MSHYLNDRAEQDAFDAYYGSEAEEAAEYKDEPPPEPRYVPGFPPDGVL